MKITSSPITTVEGQHLSVSGFNIWSIGQKKSHGWHPVLNALNSEQLKELGELIGAALKEKDRLVELYNQNSPAGSHNSTSSPH